MNLIEKVIHIAETTDHHPAGFSTLGRFIPCPGSLPASIDKPNSSSVQADEGVFAHAILADCLVQGLDAEAFVGKVSGCGRFTWTPDDAAYGQLYLDTVRDLMDDDAELMVEQTLGLDHLVPKLKGTLDAVVLNWSTGEIIDIDLKWGRGVEVSAIDNPQLQAGCLSAYEAFGLLGEFTSARGVIVQPRISGNRVTEDSWTINQLREFGGKITAAWQSAISDQPHYEPGEKQCKFCRAADDCPALANESLQLFDSYEDVDALDPVAVAELLPKLSMVEDWAAKVRARATNDLLEGRPIPGYKLIEGRRGNRSWKDEAEATALLKNRFRLRNDDIFVSKLASPAQIQKFLTTRQFAAVEELITQTEGKPALVPETDKRPALCAVSTPEDFD